MTTTTRLTELQSLLLLQASRNDRQAFEPLPDKLRDQEARVRPSLRALVKRGLAEVHTILGQDGEPAIVEVLATSAGLDAIGCGDSELSEAEDEVVTQVSDGSEVELAPATTEPFGSDSGSSSASTPARPGQPHGTIAGAVGARRRRHDHGHGRGDRHPAPLRAGRTDRTAQEGSHRDQRQGRR